MRSWKDAITEGLVGGSIAAALSAAVVTIAGQRESGSAIAPINAVSHWLWSDEAAHDLRQECLNAHWFMALAYAQDMIAARPSEYNESRPPLR